MSDYEGPYKDRRNELVFIGVGLYEDASQVRRSRREPAPAVVGGVMDGPRHAS